MSSATRGDRRPPSTLDRMSASEMVNVIRTCVTQLRYRIAKRQLIFLYFSCTAAMRTPTSSLYVPSATFGSVINSLSGKAQTQLLRFVADLSHSLLCSVYCNKSTTNRSKWSLGLRCFCYSCTVLVRIPPDT